MKRNALQIFATRPKLLTDTQKTMVVGRRLIKANGGMPEKDVRLSAPFTRAHRSKGSTQIQNTDAAPSFRFLLKSCRKTYQRQEIGRRFFSSQLEIDARHPPARGQDPGTP